MFSCPMFVLSGWCFGEQQLLGGPLVLKDPSLLFPMQCHGHISIVAINSSENGRNNDNASVESIHGLDIVS